MNNIFIIIPTYNDSRSLNKLLYIINKNINKRKDKFRVIVVNDCSSEKITLKIKNFNNIKSIKILNLKKNVGSQKQFILV